MSYRYYCRDLVRGEESTGLNEFLEQRGKTYIPDVITAISILKIPVRTIADKTCLIGTRWYLPEVQKDIKYQSIASNVINVFNKIFSDMNIPLCAEILAVKEKAHYDRSRTIKITQEGCKEGKASFITFITAVCDIPKKQSNSSGKGIMITDIAYSESESTLGDLLESKEMQEKTVIEWLKLDTFTKIEECAARLNRALSGNQLEEVQILAKKLNEYTESFAEQVGIASLVFSKNYTKEK